MPVTYYQAIQNAQNQNEKIAIFEATWSYLVGWADVQDCSIVEVEQWCLNAPYGLLRWCSKRWIRETAIAYKYRVEQTVESAIYDNVLKHSY